MEKEIVKDLDKIIEKIETLKKESEPGTRKYYKLDYIITKLKESLDMFKHTI